MPIRKELKPYALRLGFPESETLGGVFSILFDDDESVRLLQALPGSVQELSERTELP